MNDQLSMHACMRKVEETMGCGFAEGLCRPVEHVGSWSRLVCVVVTALHTGWPCPQQGKAQVLLDIRPPEKQLGCIC